METENKITKLKNELVNFANRLSKLLIERSKLYKAGIAIKAQYVLSIGVFELKKYRILYNIEKIRRKIAIYQIAMNKGEVISEDEVDNIISEDTKDFQKQLELLTSQLKLAKEFQKADKLSHEKNELIDSLYQEILRKIHPDLNPNFDDKNLWAETKEAFANDDLEKLQEIIKAITNKKITYFDEKDSGQLIERKITLQRRIYEEKLRLRDMENEFPYNKTTILDDEDMVKEVVSEIKEEIKKLEKKYQELQIRLDFIKDPQRGIS